MSTPKHVIEAAAMALFLRERKYHTPTKDCPEPPEWEDLAEISYEHFRGEARAALTAAQESSVVYTQEGLDTLGEGAVIKTFIGGKPVGRTWGKVEGQWWGLALEWGIDTPILPAQVLCYGDALPAALEES